ncbi:cutinase family protein [Rhodococcus rhodnii]|uniref:Cutinase n=2 Tax=Rhodococcus rhodnii TaxID=38312 RepID=R7WMT6_9NOCA|nr:cutinase family protein [Rhodococcus rhodnii]EOM76636.1 hypothetical protein Rrhod_2033 [Rhodococcus rhodnii LMG 5362]TXG89508.1 cutinase family protein [Rhodococcus rhodnii]
MSWTGGKKRSRGSRLRRLVLIAVALVVVVVLVVVGLWYLLAGRLPDEVPTPPGVEEPPTAQPEHCPDVQVVAIPGTWESSPTDDPYAPQANPASLMLNVTQPLQQQFEPSRADVFTVPYVAQFSNPVAIPPDGQQSYNNSRGEGTQVARDFLVDRMAECGLTKYVLAGFSQGAVIAGDLASSIGRGDGPVAAEDVLGVALIADGRRDPAHGIPVGPEPAGVGAELSLAGLDVPGITMTGARENGFGELDDRTYQICAPSDGICDAPAGAFSPGNWLSAAARIGEYVGNPVHAQYASFVVDDAGTTSTQWVAGWAASLIEQAPAPPHS